MATIYKMSDGALMTINMENYSEDEFLLASMDFLGCNANTHKIHITEEVFKRCASTVLGKFVVAKVAYGDASGHAPDEVIVGYIPREQNVRYIRNKQNYLRGVVDAVISKQYASEFCDIFTKANSSRSVSVEMGVEEEPYEDGTIAKDFNIVGVTVLGMAVRPSSPGSTINIKRFEDNSEEYYKSVWQKLAEREQYINNRKIEFEGKTYSVNTTELKETPWGEVDKTELRNKVMEASNRSELVKKVYLKVLDGWEDAPSENLKYPVMELIDNTFYYNRFALASALAYARQHDEADVISKVNKLYDKFKLAEEGEEENMSKKFEDKDKKCPECGKPIEECECAKDEELENEELGEEQEALKAEECECPECEDKEDEAECSEDEKCADEKCADEQEDSKEAEEECSEDEGEKEEEKPEEEEKSEEKEECSDEEEMADKDAKISELENIIMEKDAEIAELKKYKEDKECAERDFAVQQTLEELRECVDEETLESLKAEGLACKLSDIDGWKNKAKALAFDRGSKKEMSTSIWSMAIPKPIAKESTSKWDSI